MDRREPEDASSSPSANRTVVSITAEEGVGNSVAQVTLDDGSFFFAAAAEIEELGLSCGEEIDSETLEGLKRAASVSEAARKALSLLAQYEHSALQLKQKLQKRGYPEAVIRSALERLQDRGYLDDRRFAESWVRSRLSRHPEGPSLLLAGLLAKGVAREIALAAITDTVGEAELEDTCASAGRKLLKKTGMDREKLTQALLQRGFPSRVVKAFVESLNLYTK